MSLNNQDAPQELTEARIVMKYSSATIDEFGNIDWEPILQNCEANTPKWYIYSFSKPEWENVVISLLKNDLKDCVITINSFNPETLEINCTVNGLSFNGEISPVYKGKNNEKIVGYKLNSPSDIVNIWDSVRDIKNNVVVVTQDNISKFNRTLSFQELNFHTDNINLWYLDLDWFTSSYWINEEISTSSNSILWKTKLILSWTILWAWIMYWAQNLNSNDIDSSSSSFREFAAETRNKVSANLMNREVEVPVIWWLWAITILNNNGITDYDASIVNDIVLIKWDMITVTYNWDKLISMKNQNGHEFYK